jgi:hypothetical protein
LIISTSTAAPAKAVMISLMIPVPIDMCGTLNSQPPMKAPMIPTMTVPMQPVWMPPINHSASRPAMPPTMIQTTIESSVIKDSFLLHV